MARDHTLHRRAARVIDQSYLRPVEERVTPLSNSIIWDVSRGRYRRATIDDVVVPVEQQVRLVKRQGKEKRPVKGNRYGSGSF